MYYIYKFLNKKEEVIYVGITANINTRIRSQHFTNNGHLDEKCYDDAEIVVYSKCFSKDDASIKERYLINKLMPKYNDKMKNNSKFNFIIDDFQWKYIAIDKDKINKKKENKKVKESKININKIQKSSLLINAKYNMNKIQLRLLNQILYINQGNKYKNDITVRLEDLQSCILNNNQSSMKSILKELENLNSKIVLQDENIKVFTKVEYSDISQTYKIRLTSRFREIIEDNRERRTKIDLGVIKKLNTTYSIRLYEMIKYYLNKNKMTRSIEVDLDELKEKLAATTYERFANLNQKVIQPSISEINNKTEYNIAYDVIKRGRKTDSITFTTNSKS